MSSLRFIFQRCHHPYVETIVPANKQLSLEIIQSRLEISFFKIDISTEMCRRALSRMSRLEGEFRRIRFVSFERVAERARAISRIRLTGIRNVRFYAVKPNRTRGWS